MVSGKADNPTEHPVVRESIAAGADFPQARRSLSNIRSSPAVLQLPIKWKLQSKATGPATTAQLAITWSTRSDGFVLQLGDDEPAEKAAETFLAQMYGFTAAMMADKIIGRDGERDISQAMWRLCQARAATMDHGNLRELVRGRSIPLICADHSSFWRLQPLYYSSKAPTGDPVRSVDDFGHLIGDALSALGQEQRIANIDIGPIAVLVRELFANTHHHARTDLDGNALRRSVRGVNFAIRSVDPKITASSGRLKILQEYYRTFTDIRTSTEMPFAEISVIDSGPGLAARRGRRLLHPDTSIAAEVDLVRDCFRKASSSFNTIAHGWGLPRVMQILKSSGGFIKVKTGRLSLYRWFDPTKRSDDSFSDDDIDFIDTEFGNDLVAHAPVTGAAITILFPLGVGR